jgi:hypothetical protein
MKQNNIILLIISILIISCNSENEKKSLVSLFNNKHDTIQKIQNNFNDDDIGIIEGLRCNDSSLVVLDYHSGECYSLFNLSSQNLIGRFGTVGQGPGEILLGSYGFINGNYYYIFNNQNGIIAKYDMDSLHFNIHYLPKTLTKYKIPDAFFSQIIPVNDSLYFGAGTYKEKYQFVFFNSGNEVIDCNVEIYNSRENWHAINKYLSNQGILRKHPHENKFIYAVKNSSNIDIVQISDNKINIIKSLRLSNPRHTPDNSGNTYQVTPDIKSPIGYIDIAVSDNYIYTLYTDKKIIGDNGNGNTYSSNEIFVFDWKGNPIRKYRIEEDAYYIAVNENNRIIYLATRNKDAGWTIDTYSI